jgi:hypothetical protein
VTGAFRDSAGGAPRASGPDRNLLASLSRMGALMKQLIRGGVLAALAVSFLVPHVAFAASPANPEDFIKKLMGRAPGKGKTPACFNRVYDDAHLAAHPQQNVRTMTLLVLIDSENPDSYDLRVGVNFRNRKHYFETEGDCVKPHPEDEAGGAVTAHCAVACDGGGIDVALKDNGSVLLTIPNGARMWRPGAEDNDTVHGAFGPDDKLFRVDRAALSECMPLAADKAEKALLARGQ